MLGVIAALALCIYALYFYALVKLIPITLTLPGIAGLILTLGVAADANIVVFERVKEEVRAGRSVSTAITTGYRKGLTAIIDANIVTFLVAFILFIIATAGVQGFAFTLGLGVIVSLFTAVLATQAILYSLRGTRLLASKAALGAGEQKSDRVPHRLHGQGEVVLLLLGLHPARLRAGDVRQGHQLRHRLRRRHADHRAAGEGGHGRSGARRGRAARPRRGEDPDAAEPRAGPARRPDLHQGAAEGRVQRGRREAELAFGQADRPSIEEIGPSFGKTVARSAIYAIIASLLIISIYIALRFEWKFAVPVLIALMHDILIVAGVYALIGREVTTSTVAALLTILGYSLYDTIIVFDRVRENIPRMPSAAFSQIVNRSLSEVIVRSLATSASARCCRSLALMLFGGETLRDFAFALLIGIASGTYSSIFIATPVLQHWKEREPGFRARHARILERLGSVPPYATVEQGGPIDVQPKERGAQRSDLRAARPGGLGVRVPGDGARPRRRGGDGPARQPQPAAAAASGRPAGGRRARARAEGATASPPPTAPPTSSGNGENGDAKDRKPRNRRHGRPR